MLKVEESANWRSKLLMICSIESESQRLGWANRNANGKGTQRNEEKRNIPIECICLLASLVIAIFWFRSCHHASVTASPRTELAIHIMLIQ
jgi:hypothetical protein